ncbi:hypothetical protein JQ620_09355 [Bradyrhizobium sp. AUGA SZCCT0274]|uniref:hypothetical protein n=1 Tax=Bradyrhizobium sp. AUGA SZCCT0274 TaxID=2807670 RepID=UPI001BAC920B|nr:hypothetical protein [Bradyrhizobium sp. AUGA SZCCT0274]MBR1240331.1 hypothetical protein [Bradyrhizobium sp. AUGA SZCCT0274]
MMLKASPSGPALSSPPLTETTEFHKNIVRMAAGDTDLAAEVGDLFGIAPDHRMTPADWHHIAAAFRKEACGDMNPDQAEDFAGRVFAELTGAQSPKTFRDLVDRSDEFCHDAAAELCEPLIAFVLWAFEIGRRHEASDLVFLARDAIPFFVVARHLKARGLPCARLSLLDVNREMMPRSAGDAAFPGDLDGTRAEAYLAEALRNRHRPILVDTGLYGTLVKPILASKALPDPAVVFLASKNPHIAGYLNGLEAPCDPGRRSPLGRVSELFCDVLENWPKLYTRAELCEGARLAPRARLTDPVSATAAFALYRMAAKQARACDLIRLDPSGALDRFAHRLEGHVLAERLPRWTHADRWHAAWTLGPVPPTGNALAEP